MTYVQDDDRAAAILRRKARGLLELDDALTELADADCAAAIAVMIAERVDLRAELVSEALEAPTDETISVICRAAGFRINSYSALLRMRRRQNRGTASAPAYALTFFSDLSRASAERLLRRMTTELAER
jgi:23S rRNA C2498 (ribose-2'-O)-methylase RlmM